MFSRGWKMRKRNLAEPDGAYRGKQGGVAESPGSQFAAERNFVTGRARPRTFEAAVAATCLALGACCLAGAALAQAWGAR